MTKPNFKHEITETSFGWMVRVEGETFLIERDNDGDGFILYGSASGVPESREEAYWFKRFDHAIQDIYNIVSDR